MHGRVGKIGTGKYGDATVLGALAGGQYLGEQVLTESGGIGEFTARAATSCAVLRLPRAARTDLASRRGELRAYLEGLRRDRSTSW